MMVPESEKADLAKLKPLNGCCFAILAVLCLLNAVSCRSHALRLLPEVTPDMQDEEIRELPVDMAGGPWLGGSGVVLLDRQGKFFTYDIQKKSWNEGPELGFTPTDLLFAQNGLLLVRDSAKNSFILLEIASRRQITVMALAGVAQILGLNARFLVYSGEDGMLHVYSWLESRDLAVTKVNERLFPPATFLATEMCLLGVERLYRFSFSAKKFTINQLPRQAGCGFFLAGGSFYYGSVERELVKVSFPSVKVRWKRSLAAALLYPPCYFHGRIVALTADNNLLFLTSRGSVSKWEHLDSIPSAAPLAMADHLAVFLFDRTVKFIHYLRQKTAQLKLAGRLLGAPVLYNRDIFFLQEVQKKTMLARAGNRVELVIGLDPQQAIFQGKALKLIFRTINLLEPVLTVQVRHADGEIVLKRTMSSGDDFDLVMLPEKPGRYHLLADVRANNVLLHRRLTFKVLDPQQVIIQAIFPWLRLLGILPW